MYYRLKYGKNYIFKILVLVIAAVLAELSIWWAMVREESVDWIAGQIVHQPWPYAISEIDDGRIIVGNVLIGFEVTLPAEWQVVKSKHPSFYLGEIDNMTCEVTSSIDKQNEEYDIVKLQSSQPRFFRIYIGGLSALEEEQTTNEGNFIYNIQIPIKNNLIKYTLFASQKDKFSCRQEFEKIRQSFIYYQ